MFLMEKYGKLSLSYHCYPFLSGTLLFICRKNTKTIYLKNNQMIPISWKMTGHEALGEEFSFVADSGIVEPNTEYPLTAHFRAIKPINPIRRMIRLEVCQAQIVAVLACVLHFGCSGISLLYSVPVVSEFQIFFLCIYWCAKVEIGHSRMFYLLGFC